MKCLGLCEIVWACSDDQAVVISWRVASQQGVDDKAMHIFQDDKDRVAGGGLFCFHKCEWGCWFPGGAAGAIQVRSALQAGGKGDWVKNESN